MTAAELAHALGGVRSGRQWKCRCVAHEDSSPSLIIFDGRDQVQLRCLAGCEPVQVIDALRSRGLWEGRGSALPSSPQHSQATKVSHETRALEMRERARRLFFDSMLTIGTPAQRYLESREIWSVAREIEDVRFHPACPRERGSQPAIVVAMRSMVSHTIQAVQRIFLRGDVKDGAMMLGSAGGAAMMLEPLGVSRELHVAEGFETALSVMAMDQWPVWALGSSGAIERLGVLDGVDHLVIWGDHDAAGIKAGRICRDRWCEAGRLVDGWFPGQQGWDAADVWRARNARQ